MEKILIINNGEKGAKELAITVRNMDVYAEVIALDELQRINEDEVKALIYVGDKDVKKEDSQFSELLKVNKPILAFDSYSLLGEGEVQNNEGPSYKLTKAVESKITENLHDLAELYADNSLKLTTKSEKTIDLLTAENDLSLLSKLADSEVYFTNFAVSESNENLTKELLNNFLFSIAKVAAEWNLDSFIENSIKEIREQVGDHKVICAVSGGVDSSVTAALLSKALGNQVTCVFVNHGLMRYKEAESVNALFSDKEKFELDFVYRDEQDFFLDHLKGVTDPETKRKIIGTLFVDVFTDEIKKSREKYFLAQGTIYPDIIESFTKNGPIKSHHNVGGFPAETEFLGLVEPLKYLFKYEVRKVGLALGLPEELVNRQPFPGPGLGVRVAEEITREKIHTVQLADHIFVEELKKAGYYNNISQAFAAISNMRTVGIKDGKRTYGYAIILRAVTTIDFMNAQAVLLPTEFLNMVATKICNEVEGVNRVLYDVTNKPTSTIELE